MSTEDNLEDNPRASEGRVPGRAGGNVEVVVKGDVERAFVVYASRNIAVGGLLVPPTAVSGLALRRLPRWGGERHDPAAWR